MSASSDLIVNRGLKNIFRLKPGFGVCVDQGIASLGALNKAAGGIAKTAVIVHELGEFGTGTAKLLAGKLPSIGIEAKEADRATTIRRATSTTSRCASARWRPTSS